MANATFFSPDGGITRYPLEDTEGRIMYEEEIHGVNLLENKTNTVSGITFTVDTDGYTSASSTDDVRSWAYTSRNISMRLKAGKYFVKGSQKTAHSSGYIGFIIVDSSNNTIASFGTSALWSTLMNTGGYFTLSEDTDIGVEYKVGNGSYAFAIYKDELEITDYRPYNPQSIQHQINAQTEVLGAKNLLENVNTTYTEEGATWTVNSNKTVTINKPNASTNSSYMRINYASDSNHSMALDAAPYIGKLLKASFLDNAINGIGGRVGYFTSGSNTFNGIDDYFSTSKTFTVPSNAEKIVMYLRVDASATISNVTVKPMLRLASDPSDEYVPFAMTNRELTENVTPIIGDVALALQTWIRNQNADYSTVFVQGTQITQVGKLVVFQSRVTTPANINVSIGDVIGPTFFPLPKNSVFAQVNDTAQVTPSQILLQPTGKMWFSLFNNTNNNVHHDILMIYTIA